MTCDQHTRTKTAASSGAGGGAAAKMMRGGGRAFLGWKHKRSKTPPPPKVSCKHDDIKQLPMPTHTQHNKIIMLAAAPPRLLRHVKFLILSYQTMHIIIYFSGVFCARESEN